MRRTAALVAGLVLLVGACSDDDGDDDATTTTTAAVEATTTTTTAAPPVEETTTTTAEPPLDEGDGPAIPTDPAAYATALIEAWESGDAPTAEVFATDEAFDALFAQEGGGAGTWHLDRCEGAAGSTYCTFGAGGDPTVIVRVANEAASQSSPDAVTEVRFEG